MTEGRYRADLTPYLAEAVAKPIDPRLTILDALARPATYDDTVALFPQPAVPPRNRRQRRRAAALARMR